MGTDPKDFINRGIAAQKAVDDILAAHKPIQVGDTVSIGTEGELDYDVGTVVEIQHDRVTVKWQVAEVTYSEHIDELTRIETD